MLDPISKIECFSLGILCSVIIFTAVLSILKKNTGTSKKELDSFQKEIEEKSKEDLGI